MSGFLPNDAHLDRTFSLIDKLSEKLMARSMVMGTAESCTGGLISALCTERAGSSRWFTGGVVAYSNSVKCSLLGVSRTLVDEHGAVSGQVVEAMAKGALSVLAADISLAVSGIAGPDGGSGEKPVGTVWTGVALHPFCGRIGLKAVSAVRVVARRHHFFGNRNEVRLAAATAALQAADELLDSLAWHVG